VAAFREKVTLASRQNRWNECLFIRLCTLKG